MYAHCPAALDGGSLLVQSRGETRWPSTHPRHGEGTRDRPTTHAAQRHRPRRALGRQRRAGRLLLRARASASARSPTRASRPASRDRVSHVLEQGRVRIVLTGALRSDSPIAAHQRRHGDGVQDIALSVPDVDHAWEHGDRRAAPRASSRRTSCATTTAPSASRRSRPTATRCTRSSSAAATRRVPARLRRAVDARRAGRATRAARDRPHRRQRRARPMEEWVKFYERRLRDDRDGPLLRRGDLDRVLGADVEGRHRRQRAASSSRSTSPPRASASRRSTSTSSSTRARRAAHRPRDARHRRHGRGRCASAASSS